MHQSNVPDTAILRQYIDAIDTPSYKELIFSSIWPKFALILRNNYLKESISVAATEYKIWGTEGNGEEVKLWYSITNYDIRVYSITYNCTYYF